MILRPLPDMFFMAGLPSSIAREASFPNRPGRDRSGLGPKRRHLALLRGCDARERVRRPEDIVRVARLRRGAGQKITVDRYDLGMEALRRP